MEKNTALSDKSYDDNCFRELEAKLVSRHERERRLARLKRKDPFKDIVEPPKGTPEESEEIESDRIKREFIELKKLVMETPELDFLRNRMESAEENKIDLQSIAGYYRIVSRSLKELVGKKSAEAPAKEVVYEYDKKNEQKIAELEKTVTEQERENFVLRETVTLKDRKFQESCERYDKLAFDFNKYKERTTAEIASKSSKSFEDVICRILPVIDDFERALAASKTTDDEHALSKGVEMILQQFYAILRQIGIEPIDAHNQPFDPKYHEALMTEISDECPEDTVLEVIRNGYMFNSKLLRPATVKVSKKQTAQQI